MHEKEGEAMLKKIMLSLTLPLGLGCLGGLYNYGAFPINNYYYWMIEAVLVLTMLSFVFRKDWEKSQGRKIEFFNYVLPPFKLKYFVLFAGFLLLIKPFIPKEYHMITHGVVSLPILEELTGRSIILRAQGTKQFFILALLSSAAFSFMHWLYEPNLLSSLFTNFELMPFFDKFFDHFSFSFIAAILVYNTKRLEFAMLLHIVSNLKAVTAPSLIASGGVMAFTLVLIFQALLLGGCRSKKQLT